MSDHIDFIEEDEEKIEDDESDLFPRTDEMYEQDRLYYNDYCERVDPFTGKVRNHMEDEE